MLPMNKQATDYINGYKPHLIDAELLHAVTSLRYRKSFDMNDRKAILQIKAWVKDTAKRMEHYAEEMLGSAKDNANTGECVSLCPHTLSNDDFGFRLELEGFSAYHDHSGALDQFASLDDLIAELDDGNSYILSSLAEEGHLPLDIYDSI